MIRTKAYLLTRLADDYTRIEALLNQLTEAQMQAPHFYGQWSVKDTLAHLAVWDQRGARWIAEALRGKTPSVLETGLTWGDVSVLNEQTYNTSQMRLVQDVRGDFQNAYRVLIAQVQAVSDDDLTKAYRVGGATTPVKLRNIIAWRYMHWHEHLRSLRAWLKRQPEEEGL